MDLANLENLNDSALQNVLYLSTFQDCPNTITNSGFLSRKKTNKAMKIYTLGCHS